MKLYDSGACIIKSEGKGIYLFLFTASKSEYVVIIQENVRKAELFMLQQCAARILMVKLQVTLHTNVPLYIWKLAKISIYVLYKLVLKIVHSKLKTKWLNNFS
jgi:hypothetical protein